jgi:D-mannonate dehydratase
MKLSFLFFGNTPDEKWQLCRQMGISCAIAKLAPELTGQEPPYDLLSLKRSRKIYNDHGFELHGLEGDQFDMDRIKFGLPGRDEDIKRYKQMLRNMGETGIPLLCYNFMAGLGWYRTSTGIPERGGALVSGFESFPEEPLTSYGKVPEARIRDNYEYFLEQVLPVAEDAGVLLALHPDDPPVSPLRGIGRIFSSADGIRRALALSDSPNHGLTFCQGTYVTMGEDPGALAREFAGRISFLHIRDVTGTADSFRETFHDNGPTDMVKMFETYRDIGYNGPLRSDHVPTMAGEANSRHGYAMKGNLFGIGYIKGIAEALRIPIE